MAGHKTIAADKSGGEKSMAIKMKRKNAVKRTSNMNYFNETEKILDTVKKTGIADITPDWKVYTREYIEQGKIENLKDKSQFMLNRLVTMKNGTKCLFVILPADLSGAYDIWKLPTEKTAHFQIFSILYNGEPDSLGDL